mgnify:CR=1 FL=1
MNKKKITISLIIVILVLLILVLFLFFKGKTVTISFKVDDIVSTVKVKEGETVTIPDNPVKEGYIFGGFVNETGNVLLPTSKISKDVTLKANWIKNDVKTVTITYVIDNKEYKVIVSENEKFVLPIVPFKEGYTFVCWLDSNNNFISKGNVLLQDITLKAYFIKNGVKTSTIKFDALGGSSVDSLIIETGKNIILPIIPVKDGYKFGGWFDLEGKEITNSSVINNNLELKALWKEPYTCPDNCQKIEDGSKCIRETTTDIIKTNGCPAGTRENNGTCLNYSKKYQAFSLNQAPWWGCNGNDFKYTEEESGGAVDWCVPRVNKVNQETCPSGYTRDGDICKKSETLSCLAS